ncbi:hypothetical protein HPB48_013783 [Haemaphysalis longicornis]|uniref:Endothelin-converting enzyme 1 n=1 Tax=Haemaphysalis longicornis TaxID=44386 RepID=A0A9J6GZN1_HAELO|nr:hypothetical protein HPB48_013783 [Haemaphysalis longicornis]
MPTKDGTAAEQRPARAVQGPRPRARARPFRLRPSALLLACAVVVSLLVLALLLGILPRPHRDDVHSRAKICAHDECFLESSLMGSAVDRTKDPCRDFYGYACGTWKPTTPGARSTLDDVRLRTMARAALLLDEQIGNDFVGHAATLYRSCLESVRTDKDQTAKLRRFLWERGLFWPQPAPTNVPTDPLAVLVDLSLNWRLDLWFHVAPEMVRTPFKNVLRVRIQPGIVNRDWVRFLWIMRDENEVKHVTYQKDAATLFTNGSTELMTKERMLTLAALELEIAVALGTGNLTTLPTTRSRKPSRYESCENGTSDDVRCPANDSQRSRWGAALSRHLGRQVDENTTMLFWNPHFADALANVLSTIADHHLIDILGWTVVQLMGWAAHPLLGFFRLGSEEDARQSMPVLCLGMTEMVLGEAVSATLLATHLPQRTRNQIDTILASVARTFSEMAKTPTSSLSMYSGEEGGAAHNVTVWLWPKTATRLQLERSYSAMPAPSASLSFLDNWLRLAPAAALLNKKAALAGGSPMGPFRFRPFSWKPRSGAGNDGVVLPMWLMFPPFFGPGLPAGLTLGGLGTLFATLLAEDVPPSVFNNFHRPGHTEAAHCSPKESSWGSRAIGIHAAWRALQEVSSFEQGGRLYGLEEMTEAQLFFLASCLQLCDAPLSRRNECNLALQQSDAFANAFGCAEGTAMNPKVKCMPW